jgi:hypothetical protein
MAFSCECGRFKQSARDESRRALLSFLAPDR